MSGLLSFYQDIRDKITVFFLEQKDRLPLWLPVAFASGIGLYFSLTEEPSLIIGATFFCFSLFLLWDTRKKAGLFFLSLFIFLFCAGFFLIQTRTVLLSGSRIKFHVSRIKLTGRVQDITELTGGRLRIIADKLSIPDLAYWNIPQNILLTLAPQTENPKKGDEFSAIVSLSAFPSAYSPTGFDSARQNYFKKTGAVGNVYSDFKILKPSEKTFMRDKINNRINAVLPETTEGIAKALITGNAKSIPFSISQDYRNAGISHILSVSGLHMSLLAGIVFSLIRTILALIPAISLRWNTKKIAAFCALLFCFSYLQISGMSYAAQRAFIMVALMLVAVLFNRQALSAVSVAWAAFFILLFTPEALISVGFQLSFAAVIALICVYEAGIKKYLSLSEKKFGILNCCISGLIGISAVSLIASLATAPFVMFHFGQIPFYSVLGNLLTSSVTGIIIMPSLALGVLSMPFGLDDFFLSIASCGIELMNKTAHFISNLPCAVISLPIMPFWGFLLAIAGGLWICLWKGRIRLWGLHLFVCSLFSPLTTDSPDVYIRTTTAAFKNKDGFLEFREGTSDIGARKKWLTENRQNKELYKDCPYGFCLYEKNGFNIGLAYTQAGAYDACQKQDLDMLFLTVGFNGKCLAKEKIARSEIEQAGTYTLTVSSKKINKQSVFEKKGYRPWSTAYPAIRLQEYLNIFTPPHSYSINAHITNNH